MKKVGLIVNPIAGLGGRVGLKGSDGAAIQQEALRRGAISLSGERAARALQALLPLQFQLNLLVWPGVMGAEPARLAGLTSHDLGELTPGPTTAEDTRRAARTMLNHKVDLLLFAGGDGTAADIFAAVGQEQVVLGIPAGVKIHSAAFATTPTAAGDLARRYLEGNTTALRQAEVMDIDEEAVRQGRLSARLVGYLTVPADERLLQGKKAPSAAGEAETQASIAAGFVERLMQPGVAYILGPGTTTQAVAAALGLEKALLSVSVLKDRLWLVEDAAEAHLLEIIAQGPARIVVTPVGGQGFLFGRGNQPVSPRVIRAVGQQHILVLCASGKLAELRGRPLRLDTGDPELDAQLAGPIRILTGYSDQAIYPMGNADEP